MSEPLIRYWDRNFNEITREEAERQMALDPFSVAAKVYEAQDE